jgi:hypothetical protein
MLTKKNIVALRLENLHMGITEKIHKKNFNRYERKYPVMAQEIKLRRFPKFGINWSSRKKEDSK